MCILPDTRLFQKFDNLKKLFPMHGLQVLVGPRSDMGANPNHNSSPVFGCLACNHRRYLGRIGGHERVTLAQDDHRGKVGKREEVVVDLVVLLANVVAVIIVVVATATVSRAGIGKVWSWRGGGEEWYIGKPRDLTVATDHHRKTVSKAGCDDILLASVNDAGSGLL